MVTKYQWENTEGTFDELVPPGTEIDEEMYWYFLEELPPAMMRSGTFLMGEPASTNSKGQLEYMCFAQKGDKYFYVGLSTLEELQ